MTEIMIVLLLYVVFDKIYDGVVFFIHKIIRKDEPVYVRAYSLFRFVLIKIFKIKRSEDGIRYPKLHEEIIRIIKRLFR